MEKRIVSQIHLFYLFTFCVLLFSIGFREQQALLAAPRQHTYSISIHRQTCCAHKIPLIYRYVFISKANNKNKMENQHSTHHVENFSYSRHYWRSPLFTFPWTKLNDTPVIVQWQTANERKTRRVRAGACKETRQAQIKQNMFYILFQWRKHLFHFRP